MRTRTAISENLVSHSILHFSLKNWRSKMWIYFWDEQWRGSRKPSFLPVSLSDSFFLLFSIYGYVPRPSYIALALIDNRWPAFAKQTHAYGPRGYHCEVFHSRPKVRKRKKNFHYDHRDLVVLLCFVKRSKENRLMLKSCQEINLTTEACLLQFDYVNELLSH